MAIDIKKMMRPSPLKSLNISAKAGGEKSVGDILLIIQEELFFCFAPPTDEPLLHCKSKILQTAIIIVWRGQQKEGVYGSAWIATTLGSMRKWYVERTEQY